MSAKHIEELPTTREVVLKYKNKLEKCLRDFDGLNKSLTLLKFQFEDRENLETKIDSMEESLRMTNGVLSRTQALLLTERNNCQQMALHIDLLKKQHELDREKLDLLLSLNGKPVPNHYFQGELVLSQNLAKMDKLMKEQNAKLLEERSLLKEEWDRERRLNEKCKRDLKKKIQDLQDKFLLANKHQILHSQKHMQDFLSGKPVEENDIFYETHSNVCASRMDHCSDQEIKRLRKRVAELQTEMESSNKKIATQNNIIQEIKDESKNRQDKFQAQTKAMKEMLERLKEDNNQLNKRRLTEGSGFRTEIKLLKDQLQRTQRQLCFLTLRKSED